MKVILAHPGQQHSFKVAHALAQGGILLKFITCVYDSPDSFIMRALHLVLRGQDKSKVNNRRDPYLDEYVKVYYTFLSLCVIVLSRNKYTKRVSYYLDRKIADWFGIRVAKYAIRHNADAVICFSMNETRCFEYLKNHAPSVLRIVDCANSPVRYMKHIYEQDKYLKQLKTEVPSFWANSELTKQQSGIDLSDYFLAPSSFVRRGLSFCGVSQDKVFILHYGSNFKASIEKKKKAHSGPLRLIYVGQVSYRKGFPYLIKAFNQLSERDVSLDIVGGWAVDSELYEHNKNNPRVSFHGHVSHERVLELLKQSDVFVFPSLTEGFSLSVLEAMAAGLPVICSSNSGTCDIVTDGINGFVFEYDDVNKLKLLIERFIDDRELVDRLGYSAFKTAERFTWEYYSYNLLNYIKCLPTNNNN